MNRLLTFLLAILLLRAPSAVVAVEGESGATDVFLSGNYLNIGINSYGTLGSQGNAPIGLQARSSSLYPWSSDGTDRIGITYDEGHDGWGVGRDIGDLFMAGSPFEGYALSVGTDSAWNSGNEIWDLGAGTFTSVSSSSATWTLDTPFRGLQLSQQFYIPAGSTQLFIEMTITNGGTTEVNDVYVTRCIDPDVIEPEDPGTLSTTNAVVGTVADQGFAAAWSGSPDELLPAELGMWSYDPTARAHIDCGEPDEDYEGPGSLQSEFITADTNIGITAYFSTLMPGQVATLTIGYGMSQDSIEEPTLHVEEPPVLPPTSTNLLPTLLVATLRSLLLASAAMLVYWAAGKILEEDF
jgi:hypothetical protein